jgi:hypothetical protein
MLFVFEGKTYEDMWVASKLYVVIEEDGSTRSNNSCVYPD